MVPGFCEVIHVESSCHDFCLTEFWQAEVNVFHIGGSKLPGLIFPRSSSWFHMFKFWCQIIHQKNWATTAVQWYLEVTKLCLSYKDIHTYMQYQWKSNIYIFCDILGFNKFEINLHLLLLHNTYYLFYLKYGLPYYSWGVNKSHFLRSLAPFLDLVIQSHTHNLHPLIINFQGCSFFYSLYLRVKFRRPYIWCCSSPGLLAWISNPCLICICRSRGVFVRPLARIFFTILPK